MSSFKSKVINMMLRNQHLFQGKMRKEVFDMNTSIKEFRDMCEKGASKFGKIPNGIEVKEEQINGIKSEWLIPKNSTEEKLILYVHGGGYVSGSCSDHRGIVSKFAKTCEIMTLQFEYGLAPENPFPAGLNDSISVYKGLLDKGFKPENIVIAGESAGGGLTLAILLALKEQNIPYPSAAVAISPWTDLTCSSDSYKTKNKVSIAPENSWFVFSKHYAGGYSVELPLISPLFGDLHGLPPIYINSGEDDELFEDGEKFAIKAKEAGVEVVFSPGKGMVHCYSLLAPLFNEATDAMQEIVSFIQLKIGKT